jgi:hypothetical protein
MTPNLDEEKSRKILWWGPDDGDDSSHEASSDGIQ